MDVNNLLAHVTAREAASEDDLRDVDDGLVRNEEWPLEVRMPVVVRILGEATPSERHAHGITHHPFRDWRGACVERGMRCKR